MFFSRAACLFKKRKNSTSEPTFEVSDPVSQNFNYSAYGDSGIPPWMNSYANYATIEITPAPPSKKYHTKHAFDPLSSSPTWSGDEPDHQKSLPPSPPGSQSDKRRFFRNRGLDRQGNLRSEYEEIGSADWGVPEEYTNSRRHRMF